MTDHRSYIHNCLSFPEYYMYLLTECEGRTGKFGTRSGRTDLTLQISILSYDHYLFIYFNFNFFLVERGCAWQHCFVSCSFSKSHWFHAIQLVSLWSGFQPRVVYKLKIQIPWQNFEVNALILTNVIWICHSWVRVTVNKKRSPV